jgi:hypothetical protein
MTGLRECLSGVLDAMQKDAATLRAYGAEGQALAIERCVTTMRGAMHRADEELLTLEHAARESGYSAEHLGREVREGRIPNAGRKGAPRIRRADLPRKPGTILTPRLGAATIGGARRRIARTVVNSQHGVNDAA